MSDNPTIKDSKMKKLKEERSMNQIQSQKQKDKKSITFHIEVKVGEHAPYITGKGQMLLQPFFGLTKSAMLIMFIPPCFLVT